jgi:hypothetical protein
MLEFAPRVCAGTDGELRALGAHVPASEDASSCDWETVWMHLALEDLRSPIAEAQPTEDGEDEVWPQEPEGGWDGPAYWFSPYLFIRAREEDRGHPQWASPFTVPARGLDGLPGVARALAIPRPGDDVRISAHRSCHEIAEVFTPLPARLFAAAADEVLARGWHDLLFYGDRVFPRAEVEDDDPDVMGNRRWNCRRTWWTSSKRA